MKYQMGYNTTWLMPIILCASLLTLGCGDQPKNDNETRKQDAGLLELANNLKSIDDEFVPQSVDDESSTAAFIARKLSKAENDDVCGDMDFIQCQPTLLKFYMRTSRLIFRASHAIALNTALGLGPLPNGSSGQIHINENNVDVIYKKTSFLEYELLLKTNGQSVGYIFVKGKTYRIKLDLNVLDADKPDSSGGKMDIEVSFTDRHHWSSKIFINETKCNPTDPSDPEIANLDVQRNGDMWNGVAMFYNGIGADFSQELSCDQQPSDATSLAVYTGFVGNHSATKAAIFLMRRNETLSSSIENFGINNLCTNYPDFCQSLGIAEGLDPSTAGTQVAGFLAPLVNPYCATRASKDILWNSTCLELSPEVSSAPLRSSADYLSPTEFRQGQILFPDSL